METNVKEVDITRYSKGVYIIIFFIFVILPLIHTRGLSYSFNLYIAKTLIFGMVTLIMVIWFLIQKRDVKAYIFRRYDALRTFNYLALAFLAIVFISWAASEYKLKSLIGVPVTMMGLLAYITSFIFIYLIIPSFEVIDFKKLLYFSYIGYSVLGILIHYQYYFKNIMYPGEGRLGLVHFWGFGNRNYGVIPFSYMFLLCFIGILTEENRKKKHILLIPLSIFYSVMLISKTRGAWVALFLCGLFFMVYTFKYNRKILVLNRRVLVIIIAMLISIFLLVNATSNGSIYGRIDRSVKTVSEVSYDSLNRASAGRVNIWASEIKLLNNFKRLTLGIGPSSLYYYSSDYKVGNGTAKATHIHNEYLEVLITSGIIAFIAFVLLLSILNYYSYITVNRGYIKMGEWLCIIFFIVYSIFMSVLTITLMPLFVIVGHGLYSYTDI